MADPSHVQVRLSTLRKLNLRPALPPRVWRIYGYDALEILDPRIT